MHLLEIIEVFFSIVDLFNRNHDQNKVQQKNTTSTKQELILVISFTNKVKNK